MAYYAAPVENLTRTVGCWPPSEGWTSSTILPCLRGLDQATLFAAAPTQVWNPLVDGRFLTGYPSTLIQQGKYNLVPLLTGTNSDEGTGFSPTGPDTEEDLFHDLLWWRSYGLSPPTVRNLLALYPDDPCDEPPFYINNCSVFPSRGLAWRRGAAIGGDMVMHSGRRKMCEVYAGQGEAVYSYRFDTRLYGEDPVLGVPHFDNVAFSFQNVTGALGPSPERDDDLRLARSIGAAYVSFAYQLDPNAPAAWGDVGMAVDALAMPAWPAYRLEAPGNMVLNATGPWVEADTWRKEGIAYMNSYEVARELLA